MGHRELSPLLLGSGLLSIGLFVAIVAWGFRKKPVLGLCLAVPWLFSPYSFPRFFEHVISVEYIDVWLYLYMLVWLGLYVLCRRRRWWYFVLTALLFTMAVLTHHLFCCMLFPLALALFVVDSVDGGGIDWRRAMAYGAVCLWLLALLVVIMLCETMNVDAETLYGRICDRTALGVFRRDMSAFEGIFFTDTAGNIGYQFGIGGLQSRWTTLLPSLLLLSPVLLFFLWPWFAAARSAQGYGRLRYGLAVGLLLAVTLPVFLIATDHCRWFFGLFFGLMVLSAVAIGVGDRGLEAAWRRELAWCRRHPFVVVALFLYVASLTPGGPYVMPEAINLLGHFGIAIVC